MIQILRNRSHQRKVSNFNPITINKLSSNIILDKSIDAEQSINDVENNESLQVEPPKPSFIGSGTGEAQQQTKQETVQSNNQTQSLPSIPVTTHQMSDNLEYPKQQLYKHESQMPSVETYNPSLTIPTNTPHQPAHQPAHQPVIPNTDFTENSYFSNKNVQHPFPPQYYNYYDNKNPPTTSNYHLNNYAPYGHFNFSPYHSNFHSTPGYSGSSSSYINSTFPRQPWNSVGNHQPSNESIRQQPYMGNTYSLNEWSSQ